MVSRASGRSPARVRRRSAGRPSRAQTEFRYGRSTGDLKQGYSVFGWHTQGVGGDAELALDLVTQILGIGPLVALLPPRRRTRRRGHRGRVPLPVRRRRHPHRAGLVRRDQARRGRSPGARRGRAPEGARTDRLRAARWRRTRCAPASSCDLEDAARPGAGARLRRRRAERLPLARHAARGAGPGHGASRCATRRGGSSPRRTLTLYHYAPNGSAGDRRAEAALAAVRAGDAPAPPTPRPRSRCPPRRAPIAGGGERPPGDRIAALQRRPSGRARATRRAVGGDRLLPAPAAAATNRRPTPASRSSPRRRSDAARAARTGEEIDRVARVPRHRAQTSDGRHRLLRPRRSTSSRRICGRRSISSPMSSCGPTFPEAGVGEERALQTRGDPTRLRLLHPAAAAARPRRSLAEPPLRTARRRYRGLGRRGSTAADVSAWWRDHLAAEDATIVVVGDVAAAAARELVEHELRRAAARGAARADAASAAAPPTRTEALEYRDRKQSAIVMAFPAPPPTDPEAARLELLQNVTSGLAGTLFAELRGRRSLAYTVFADLPAAPRGRLALAYLATEAAKENEAREALLAELRRLADGRLRRKRARDRQVFVRRIDQDRPADQRCDRATSSRAGRDLRGRVGGRSPGCRSHDHGCEAVRGNQARMVAHREVVPLSRSKSPAASEMPTSPSSVVPGKSRPRTRTASSEKSKNGGADFHRSCTWRHCSRPEILARYPRRGRRSRRRRNPRRRARSRSDRPARSCH